MPSNSEARKRHEERDETPVTYSLPAAPHDETRYGEGYREGYTDGFRDRHDLSVNPANPVNTDNLIRVVGRDGAPDPEVYPWALYRWAINGWKAFESTRFGWYDDDEWLPFTPPTEYLTAELADEVERYTVERCSGRFDYRFTNRVRHYLHIYS